jgi:high affinity Mn2+ porin
VTAGRLLLFLIGAAACCVGTASAQEPFYIGGQANVIGQFHDSFPSPYSGPQSLRGTPEGRVSSVLTLYTGLQLPHGWDVVLDVESAGGHGLSDAFGLAGFTNLDVVRNPSLGVAPYLARFIVHKVIALSDDTVTVARTPLNLPTTLPARRVEIRAGKIGIVDFFDVNGIGGDSHMQFTNWTVDNNGAYDYAADTRGYTYGVVVEYDTPAWSVRGAAALMPTVANGIVLDTDIAHSRGENVELELRPASGLTLKLLGFVNHANMGSYAEAIDAFRAGRDAAPDIEAHRMPGRIKTGTGVNVEYDFPRDVRLFARSGWNSGDSESFAYTEVNNTVAIGGDVSGARWKRSSDRAGVAFVSNGLSEPHREYLRLGGQGFLLGDGTLTYGRETIVEAYYTARVWRGIYASIGVHHIDNPGYNRDRGPVAVPSARLHLEF